MKTHSMLLASQIQQYIKITVGDQVEWLEQYTYLNMRDSFIECRVNGTVMPQCLLQAGRYHPFSACLIPAI